MIKVISAPEFEVEVIKSEMPVVVDFFATWCGPCKALAPTLDQLSEEYAGKTKIVKIDVDQAKEMAKHYKIKGVPTMIFFKDGEIVDNIIGNLPKDELKTKIEAFI